MRTDGPFFFFLAVESEAVSSAPQAPNFREKLSNVPRATTASGPDSDSPQDLLQVRTFSICFLRARCPVLTRLFTSSRCCNVNWVA